MAPEKRSHGNSVRSYRDGDQYVVGGSLSSSRLEFSSIEQMRAFAERVRCLVEEGGVSEATVEGNRVTRLHEMGYNPERLGAHAFDIGGSGFTVTAQQVEEAADEFEELEAEDEVYLRFESASGGFGCMIPHDADYELDPDRGGVGSMAVLWNSEDDVSTDMRGWAAAEPYDKGAYVSQDATVVIE